MSALNVQTLHILDQPALRLQHPSGAEATLLCYGGHLVSFRPASGQEVLYLSPLATTANGSAVRGGVPIIFPSFDRRGPAAGVPRHGFARTHAFRHTHTSTESVQLELEPAADIQACFPHPFQLTLEVGLAADSLNLTLTVHNAGTAPFPFTAALHTYFRVDEIDHVRVRGLAGHRYIDTARGGEPGQESAPTLQVVGEVDRIYGDLEQVVLEDRARQIQIHQQGFSDVVVWNPGPTLAAGMTDLPDSDYRHMLCLEAAQALRPVTLAPDTRFVGQQRITVVAPADHS